MEVRNWRLPIRFSRHTNAEAGHRGGMGESAAAADDG